MGELLAVSSAGDMRGVNCAAQPSQHPVVGVVAVLLLSLELPSNSRNTHVQIP